MPQRHFTFCILHFALFVALFAFCSSIFKDPPWANPMILTAGLTPAWQQILVFDRFNVGAVNRAAEVHWCAAGKVLNAGINVHRLGGPSLTLCPLGGPPRVEIARQMEAQGVPCRWVLTESPTRVCTTILDRATGTMTELVENGRPLTDHELWAFRDAYAAEAARADVALLTGSLPLGTPDTFYRELIARTPCPVVADFRGRELLEVLNCKPYLVKPNRQELAATVGKAIQTDAELIDAMRWLNRQGAVWVVVTQGSGPVWVCSQSETHRFSPPPVEHVVNPLGCGDALAAGIAWAVRAGWNVPEAVRWGMAAAAAKLGELLPSGFDPDQLPQYADRVCEEEVREKNF